MLFGVVALGNKSRTPAAACPWHDGVFLGGCCDDAFDKALVDFHGSFPRLFVCGRCCPCLRMNMTGHLGRFLATRNFFRKFDALMCLICGRGAQIRQSLCFYGRNRLVSDQSPKIGLIVSKKRRRNRASSGQGLPHSCQDQSVMTEIRRP